MTGSVDQVLETVATIEPVTQATVAFPIAGTVETVEVGAGSRVAVGTPLAGLDTASLDRTLRQQQAALDQAELSLERALNGDAVGTGTDPSGGTGAIPAAYETAGGSSDVVDLGEVQTVAARSGPSDADIAAAQQALLNAQQHADAALAAVQPAIDDATSVCAAVGPPTPPGSRPALTACTDAIAAVSAAQQAAQSGPGRGQRAAQRPSTTCSPSVRPPWASSRRPRPSRRSRRNPSRRPAERALSWVRFPRRARAAVGPACRPNGSSRCSEPSTRRRSRSSWPSRPSPRHPWSSPVAGTVVSVNMAPGDDVDAASATANIVISGRGGYEATVNVSVDDLAALEVGQAATVQPDGSDEEIEGEVVAIGVAANAGSFPITVGLDGDTSELGNGSTASVRITTGAAEDVLAVPTSAITVDGETATVQVPDGDDTETVTVEIGAIGATWTEIISGLAEGQEVVLADLDEPLPGSATDTSSTNTGVGRFSGGFPGGGGFAPPGG